VAKGPSYHPFTSSLGFSTEVARRFCRRRPSWVFKVLVWFVGSLSDLVGCSFCLPFRRVVHVGEGLVVQQPSFSVVFRWIFVVGGLFDFAGIRRFFFFVTFVFVCFRFCYRKLKIDGGLLRLDMFVNLEPGFSWV